MKHPAFRKLTKTVFVVLFWLAVWQGLAMIVNSRMLLASPVDTIKALFDLVKTETFWQSVWSSVSNILLGFFLAMVVAILTAVAAACVPLFRTLFSPFMGVVRSVPVASFIVVALIWVGAEGLSTLISFLMVLPVLYTNLLSGILAVDKGMKETTQVFRMPLKTRFVFAYLPAILPHFTAGCTVALGLCWKAGVAAEVIGQTTRSIGEQLYLSKLYLNTAELFAYTLVIIALSAAFEKGFLFCLENGKEGLFRDR